MMVMRQASFHPEKFFLYKRSGRWTQVGFIRSGFLFDACKEWE